MSRILSAERTLLVQPDSVETDYIYERAEEGNYRVTTMGEGAQQRVINSGLKVKRSDVVLSQLQTDSHYVVRVSVSTETEDEEKPESVATNWTMFRRKTRATFTNAGTVPLPNGATAVVPWRIDLTQVSTTRAMRSDAVELDPAVITFEIELEMPSLHEDTATPMRAKVLAFHDGLSLLSCAMGYANRNSEGPIRWTPPSSNIVPHSSAAPSANPLTSSRGVPPPRSPLDPNRHPDFPQMPLERVSQPSSLRTCFDRCFAGHPQFDSPNRFIGTMPVNFARRHLWKVQREPYFISEKTDGVRFMLHITRGSLGDSSSSLPHTSPSAYLIDRSNNYYKVPALDDFANFASSHADTLLDGEMVKRHDRDGYYFLIFDAITCDGSAVWQLPMEERLAQIILFVARFDAYRSNHPSQAFPFAIMAKEIMPKSQFKLIRSRIEEEKGETVYRSPNLCHLTDGLIFMPDGPYPLFTCQTMYKWKFVDRQTIDFEVVFRSETSPTVDLLVGGNAGSTVLTRTTDLTAEDISRLRADVRHSLRPNLVIAEMGFEANTGLWRYHKLRPDKDKANYISIAMDTMESIAENIKLAEVEAAL